MLWNDLIVRCGGERLKAPANSQHAVDFRKREPSHQSTRNIRTISATASPLNSTIPRISNVLITRTLKSSEPDKRAFFTLRLTSSTRAVRL